MTDASKTTAPVISVWPQDHDWRLRYRDLLHLLQRGSWSFGRNRSGHLWFCGWTWYDGPIWFWNIGPFAASIMEE